MGDLEIQLSHCDREEIGHVCCLTGKLQIMGEFLPLCYKSWELFENNSIKGGEIGD